MVGRRIALASGGERQPLGGLVGLESFVKPLVSHLEHPGQAGSRRWVDLGVPERSQDFDQFV